MELLKLKLNYCNKKVEGFFKDFNAMKRKIGPEKTKTIKKFCNQLEAAKDFSVYLSVGSGKPHPLYENKKGWYGAKITGSVSLLFMPETDDLSPEGLRNCKAVELKGVLDYHGGKDNWLIP